MNLLRLKPFRASASWKKNNEGWTDGPSVKRRCKVPGTTSALAPAATPHPVPPLLSPLLSRKVPARSTLPVFLPGPQANAEESHGDPRIEELGERQPGRSLQMDKGGCKGDLGR